MHKVAERNRETSNARARVCVCVCVCVTQGSDIGVIQEATVRLVEKGLGAAWHMSEIEVLNKKTGAKV